RPCQRCIKRGLQDACHDGVRKKAKYLHDAPDGALMPGVGGNFYNNAMRNNVPLSRNGANAVNAATQQNPSPNFFPATQPGSYNAYQENPLNQNPFTGHSPVSPTFSMKPTPPSQHHGLPSVHQRPPSMPGSTQGQNPFAGPLFDPSDPA